jgi:uncharacterized protein (TIGR00255 family)
MIYSMTAFARGQNQSEHGSLVCEIRSINHRYLEISLHLPEALRVLEMPIREHLRDTLKRGKIECLVRYQPSITAENSLFTINAPLAQALSKASGQIAAFMRESTPASPTDILRFPGVLETKDANLGKLQEDVMALIAQTVTDLVAARGREGEELKQTFLLRLDSIQQELAKVRERLPSVLVEQRERLLKRFSDVKIELDPNRLEQEMVMYAQRIDIAEEIDRTETHVTEIRRILKQGGLVGRRLDFLLQELNREANTTGSKSTDTVITHAAVEMKVLIEQVREQVQNIE